jgi:hypothetical protein
MLSRNTRYLESLTRTFRVVARYDWCVCIAESLILREGVSVRRSQCRMRAYFEEGIDVSEEAVS